MLSPHIQLFHKIKIGLELVSLPHFRHSFWRKIFLLLYSINGSCVVFLVHGTILQQWTSLLKDSAGIEKRKNFAHDCWRIVPATVEESCQWLSNNGTSNCWRIVLATVEQSCQRLLHIILNCWTIAPVTVDKLCQWLLEELCQWLTRAQV